MPQIAIRCRSSPRRSLLVQKQSREYKSSKNKTNV